MVLGLGQLAQLSCLSNTLLYDVMSGTWNVSRCLYGKIRLPYHLCVGYYNLSTIENTKNLRSRTGDKSVTHSVSSSVSSYLSIRYFMI